MLEELEEACAIFITAGIMIFLYGMLILFEIEEGREPSEVITKYVFLFLLVFPFLIFVVFLAISEM